MKTTMIRTLMGLGLVAIIAGPAAAQGRGGFFGRGGMHQLLGNESVQKELKLDDQQVEKARELSDKMNEKAREARQSAQDLEGEERMKKMQEVNAEITTETVKAAGEFLKPEQLTRLKQISYQQRGAQAFNDPEVAKKLNLTEDQKSAIHEIEGEAREQMMALRDEFQNDREGAMKKMGEIRKQTLAKIEGKLNDEQKKTWAGLIGSHFDVVYPPRNN
ncbi:MAG: hypothetical protein ACYC61_00660 [Isosphaeraceae bacterium]